MLLLAWISIERKAIFMLWLPTQLWTTGGITAKYELPGGTRISQGSSAREKRWSRLKGKHVQRTGAVCRTCFPWHYPQAGSALRLESPLFLKLDEPWVGSTELPYISKLHPWVKAPWIFLTGENQLYPSPKASAWQMGEWRAEYGNTLLSAYI